MAITPQVPNQGVPMTDREGRCKVDQWYPFFVSLGPFTPIKFAQLPTNALIGATAIVTDSNTATWGATVAGGGANQVGVFWNGLHWTVWAK
jgi:hypothetical protein